MNRTLFDPATLREVIERVRRLSPDAPRRWGRMTAPQMVAHLTDQMYHGLGDRPCTPVPGPLRWPPLRYAFIYWIAWPKGRAKGPPDAFLTQPVDWDTDLANLIGLLERFGERSPAEKWPDHGLFGRMRGVDWGFFCYKHFDHHLQQFGQ
jgi:hypothetical protein